MVTFEEGLKNLKDLAAWYEKNSDDRTRNEATTRLHLIDTILFDCLGWPKENCKTEERFDNKYTDYSFFCPRRMLIVEAKKEGAYFELPAGFERGKIRINTLIDKVEGVGDALNQAMAYC